MKNKNILIGVVVIIVLVVGVFLFVSNQKKVTVNSAPKTAEEQALTMKPEDIGLILTPTTGNKEIEMKISDISKFSSYEYDMNYDAVVNGETVSQGATGSGDVKSTDTSINRVITIGTCSAKVCKYDQGVKKVTFVIRINLKNGKTGIIEKDVNLQ